MTAQKISPEDLTTGIRPEEINRILNLKKSLGHNEALSTFATRYRQLGWTLRALTDDDGGLELDFQQPPEVWGQALADLALDGIQVNLAVCTGAISNLMVLEVRGRDAAQSLSRQGEWRSRCVAQVGVDWEHHYFFSPPHWHPPAAFLVDSCQVQVFGEGGLVMVPPSLDPQCQEPIRWLQSPWEIAPAPPSPVLLDFLQQQIPAVRGDYVTAEPSLPSWEDIYSMISPHPAILQALLAPAGTSQDYYQNLLQTSLVAGISDVQVLLGILWHAPLGDARHSAQGLQNLKDMVASCLPKRSEDVWSRMNVLLHELSKTLATMKNPEVPLHTGQATATAPQGPNLEPTPSLNFHSRSQPPVKKNGVLPPMGHLAEGLNPINKEPLLTNEDGRNSVDTIKVSRHQYESMIYELGKLGAWHEIQKRYYKENNSMRKKFEAQRQQEIDQLRQLLTEKNKKGWWR